LGYKFRISYYDITVNEVFFLIFQVSKV